MEVRPAWRKLLFLRTKTLAGGVRTVCGVKHLKNSATNQVCKKGEIRKAHAALGADAVPVAIQLGKTQLLVEG